MIKALNLPHGYSVLKLNTVGSTNDELKNKALNESVEEGIAIWSLVQTSGKGRQNRRWISEIGNMYISVLFRPNCYLTDAAQLGFLPVIAANKALKSLINRLSGLKYKWPNDLLLNKKKIGGTLLEAGFDKKFDSTWVVVGFGMNLKHFPKNTSFPASSIKDELGVELKIEKLVESYISNLAVLYSKWSEEGFEPIRKKWLNFGHEVGEPLIIKFSKESITGLFCDLDENGSLVIKTNNGLRRVSAGDVYSMADMGDK
jgi:BirA family biotin operon repressor/biotin-[acetyl-CoA-carboxylase] ligase